jgi:hypothetical protein
MSFIEQLDFTGVFEPESVPQGEYQVRVVSLERKVTESSGNAYLNVRLEIPSEGKSKDIYEMLNLPMAKDDIKTANLKKSRILAFLKAIGYNPAEPIDPEKVRGCMGWAILGEENDNQYGKRNRVKTWVSPK